MDAVVLEVEASSSALTGHSPNLEIFPYSVGQFDPL